MFVPKNTGSRRSFALSRRQPKSLMIVLMALMVFIFANATFTFADTKINATVDEQAKRNLTNYVYGQMSQNTYAVEGGGTIDGTDLFVGKGQTGYDLDEDAFNTLTSKAQTEAVGDIASISQEAIGNEKADGVSQSTVTRWWKELQTKQGVGSKFMNEILKNAKPDFVAANNILQPFSGPIGIIIGCLVVITMALLGLSMAADIMYITLPPIRMLVADDDNGDKPAKSKIFSYDALYAVKAVEEESDSGKGGGKQSLGIYLRRRIGALILLGICLLYLVNGQLYTLVGWILDLLRGFLKF